MTKLKQRWIIFPSCSLTSLNDKGAHLPLRVSRQPSASSVSVNSVPSSFSISQALSHCLNHQCRFSLAFYLWPSFFLISTLYPLMILSTLPAQTALLVNDFLNLYIQLQPLPSVPISWVHFLYITSQPLWSTGFWKGTAIC